MTADQRPDQLEPLVSQTLAVADRHTAQLKQIFGAVNQLLEAGKVQSDDVQFVLREMDELRQEVRADLGNVQAELGKLTHKIGAIEQNQSIANTRIGDVENAVSLVGIQVINLDTKLDRILDLLSGKNE
ncbi:hypothetical protein [Hymenobacter sp. PAMC 26628]|uniref:hypothetical protein n=1 Tax=Hymenobacter sp. PAMC 26628 TaxID=1484118 RepID=UPI00076FFBFB|nr:hypothetical protein [Hymenobacter sp. PAMC 26628]AMJ64482.1 hypothetical protein AXW84_02855 [Hymenobacter sp. PAMC 26628]